jgi:hypothetical protein|tara:strand:+ start:565 stop:723 length:159 start_codon:yes stop_codon:yes gene_type:complete
MVQQANDKSNLLHMDDMIDETPNKSMDGAHPSSNRKSSAGKHATNSTDQKKT